MSYTAPKQLQAISDQSWVPLGAVVPDDVEKLGKQNNTAVGGAGSPLIYVTANMAITANPIPMEIPPCPGLRAVAVGVSGLAGGDEFDLTISDETGELATSTISADGFTEMEWSRATDGWLTFEFDSLASGGVAIIIAPIPSTSLASGQGLEAEGYVSDERLRAHNENGVSVRAMSLMGLGAYNASLRPQVIYCYLDFDGLRGNDGAVEALVADLPCTLLPRRQVGMSAYAETTAGSTSTEINVTLPGGTTTLTDFTTLALGRSSPVNSPSGNVTMTVQMDVPSGATFKLYSLTVYEYPED